MNLKASGVSVRDPLPAAIKEGAGSGASLITRSGPRSKASKAAVAQFSVGSCVRARTGAGWFVKDGAGSGAGLITRSTPVTDAVAAEPKVELSIYPVLILCR